jgi:hypothetical protein
VIETPEDAKVIQDLFATDMIDNRFTADTEVLVDSGIPSSQVSSSTTSSSQQSSSSNTTNSSNSLISSTKTGFLESILGFGAVKASAGNSDYSWPWKSGDKWVTTRPTTGWHECNSIPYGGSNITVYGCALDLVPVGSASYDVLAPKSETIKRVCKDSKQGFLKIDNMYILHLDQASIIADSTFANKAQKIGTMYNGVIPQGTLTGQCGWSTAAHIHIKFGGVTTTGGSFAIDGTSLNYATNNNSVQYTSQNVYTPPSTTPAKMNLKVNLSGPYNPSTKTMDNNLRVTNKIPTSQPYNTSPWNYTGNETYSPQSFNANAVDWVLLELRNWSTGVVVQRKAAQVDRFGNVYESNGSQLSFANITTAGSYKVIVRHRNHLGISTSVAIGLNPSVVANLDFTNNQFITFSNQNYLGTNSSGAATYGLRNGDVNSDGAIDSLDRSIVGSSPEYTSVYNKVDLNFDTEIDAIDRSIIQNVVEAVELL